MVIIIDIKSFCKYSASKRSFYLQGAGMKYQKSVLFSDLTFLFLSTTTKERANLEHFSVRALVPALASNTGLEGQSQGWSLSLVSF